MKYYIYISDAKVDMLLPQIPHEKKKKLATELKFDLKILSASRKTETDTEVNRITRLETVCNFIREYGNIGSVDEPDDYIEDTLPMSWGIVKLLPPYAFFAATTDKTILGLGGSTQHLLGYGPREDLYHSLNSNLFILHSALIKGIGDENGDMPIGASDVTRAPPLAFFIAAKDMPNHRMQRLEFIAKRLCEERIAPEATGGRNVILATPLYVALAE